MDASVSPAENLLIDAAGRIDQDIFCAKCGYNLRGLDPDQICPECGTPVGRSTQGDLLQFSDPDWVEKLARGMDWVVVGMAIAMVFGCIAGAGGQYQGATGAVLTVIFGLFGVIGWLLVTEPEPRRLFSESRCSVRAVIRITAILYFFVNIVNGWASAFVGSGELLFGVVSVLIGFVQTVAQFKYARQLALRIPDQKLARNSRIVMWGLLAVLGLSFITVLSAAMGISAASPSAGSGGLAVALAGGCAAGLAGLVFGLWAIRLLLQFRKAFKKSAKLARETWSRSVVQS